MTETEAKERAGRIATLYFQMGTGMNKLLSDDIARELCRVAQECGWQKEELRVALKALEPPNDRGR